MIENWRYPYACSMTFASIFIVDACTYVHKVIIWLVVPILILNLPHSLLTIIGNLGILFAQHNYQLLDKAAVNYFSIDNSTDHKNQL